MKICLLTIFLSLVVPYSIFAYNFESDLKLGSKGEDVRELQKILNSDLKTMVSLTGIGSIGFESDYFGPKTLEAVKRFQLIYRQEVLEPARLIFPTGFVGPLTRAKINNLANNMKKISGQGVENLDTKDKDDFFYSNILAIHGISSYDGSVGQKIVINGEGFEKKGNIVLLDDTSILDLTSDGKKIEFNVPELGAGKRMLKVKNTKGESNKSFFVVTLPFSGRPEIKTYPRSVSVSQIIVIEGVGFEEKNEILTSLGSVDGKLIENNKIEFSFDEIAGISKWMSLYKNDIDVWIYVVNKNGVSKNPIRIKLGQ